MTPASLTPDFLHRYDRQIALPQVDLAGQEKLAAAHVAIIGMGGLGNAAAQSLAAMGIGHLTLFDGDMIEASNLPRQLLFNASDIGKNKAQTAAQTLQQHSPILHVSAHACHYQAQSLNVDGANAVNLILDCTDNTQARLQVDKAARAHQLACVSGAAIRFEGAIFVSDPAPDAPCYHCLNRVWPSPEESCVERGIFSPVVSIIGYYQALIAAQLIMGIGSWKSGDLLFFDGLKHDWQRLGVAKWEQCPNCAK